MGKWTGSVHFVGALVLAVLRDGTARLFGRDGRERVKLPAQRVSDAAVCKDKVVCLGAFKPPERGKFQGPTDIQRFLEVLELFYVVLHGFRRYSAST